MFHLRKWYLDCTTPDGAAAAAYWAQAQWGALRVSYAGLLHLFPRASTPVSRSSFFATTEPAPANGTLNWTCPALNFNGEWCSTRPTVSRTLLETPSGSVHWSCIMPCAACTLDIAGTRLTGLGYIELLEMTIPPWRLPIKHLRWGRWLTPLDSLVWIDWEGPHPLTLVLRNGEECKATVSDCSIALSDGQRLDLHGPRVILHGNLGATVLASIPGAAKVLPPAIMRTHEQKWLTRGTLSPNPANTPDGWAIHERVDLGE